MKLMKKYLDFDLDGTPISVKMHSTIKSSIELSLFGYRINRLVLFSYEAALPRPETSHWCLHGRPVSGSLVLGRLKIIIIVVFTRTFKFFNFLSKSGGILFGLKPTLTDIVRLLDA